MRKNTIAVFGLGAVGSKLAYFLTKMGFTVKAFDTSAHLFDDSGMVATNLSHNSGAEYCRRISKANRPTQKTALSTHVRTAELCIDGGIATALMYGSSSRISTGHIGHKSDNPLQFLVARETTDPTTWNDYQGFSLEDFESNTAYLRNFYKRRTRAIALIKGWTLSEASNELYGPPSLLGKKIEVLEGLNPDVIAAGVTDIGTSVNQAYEYALWQSALTQAENDGLQIFFKQSLKSIKQASFNRWEVETSSFKGQVDFIFLTGSFSNPLLRSKIEGSKKGIAGTFYLNTMAYAKVKPSKDKKLQQLCNRGYFTLQQDYGGMSVSLVPMNQNQEGYIALYYPSKAYFGSQIRSLRYNPNLDSEQEVISELTRWHEIIRNGLPKEVAESRSRNIIEQTSKLYPFCSGDKITIDRLVTRSVFNADTVYGPGDYRNIRVPTDGVAVVENGSIWELYGAKWTNSNLTALSGVDTVLSFFGKEQLPKCAQGLGIKSIDIVSCIDSLDLHVKDIKPSKGMATEYSRRHGFPNEYINWNHEIFKGLDS